ncbi:MAG: sigma-70 family RNA polymerase sigma factor, partial [Planctomycetales bacterium]|nr:sigma-70 family RNA polymerase sigma factor [Planctomycetales bacterium]
LCDAYDQRVWRHLARIAGGDSHRLADLFQETMLAVARAGPQLSEDTKLWGWLSRVAHNQAALHWRKHYRQLETLNRATLSAPLPDVEDAAGQLLRGELVDAVRSLLAEMDADHVALLTAKYLDEMSVAEMVDAMGGTSESVRSKLARARRDFRQRFERWESKQDIQTGAP